MQHIHPVLYLNSVSKVGQQKIVILQLQTRCRTADTLSYYISYHGLSILLRWFQKLKYRFSILFFGTN